MSVLYKALQKAEKENEQRQTSSGKGFDPERLAGSGAIKVARGRGLNLRLMAMCVVGLLVILALGLYFVTQTQAPTAPRVAAVTPTPPPTAQPEAPNAQTAGTPTASTPSSESAVTAPATSTPPVAAQPAPAPVAPAPATAAPAQVAQTPNAPAAATPGKPATPAAAPTQPTQPSPPPVEVAKAEVAAQKPEAAAPSPPEPVVKPLPTAQKPIEIPRDSPAQMLNPPISVARADAALSGVGNTVQVRQIAKDAQDNVGAGYNALLRGEYDTALGFYDLAVGKEPTSILALLGRGAALQKLKRFNEAQEAYGKVLKIDSENREALTNVTSIIAERAPAEALNRLLELEKQYPGFSPIKAQIGLSYAKLGTLDQALDYLRRAVSLSPESIMYQYDLALVLDHMNLRQQAIAGYESILTSISIGRAPPELSANDIERRVRYLRAR